MGKIGFGYRHQQCVYIYCELIEEEDNDDEVGSGELICGVIIQRQDISQGMLVLHHKTVIWSLKLLSQKGKCFKIADVFTH